MSTAESVSGSTGTAGAPLLPELNQLVRVRGRHWVVTDVRASVLDGNGSGTSPKQHLVNLISVDDDGLQDEASVIWEIEVDRLVLEKETFPQPSAGYFDEPARLAAFLDALRWGAITSADSKALQAPFRSGITIEDYQLDPLVRALAMPRVNLLIADDVGLGKTIEAGLVVQEMLLRHRARTVLVVCPAGLCLKWQREMAQKFGLEFRIVDADLVRRLRRERGLAANPWKHFPRLIVSLDWLKRPRAMSLFRELLPIGGPTYPRAFDLLVIDEVHSVAPAGRGGKYAVDSLRTKAVRELAPHFEHRLFLSATPHNGYQESFTALLELLDPQRFARGVPPDERALARIMVRRLKSELMGDPVLSRADGRARFPKREIVPIEVDYPDEEREIHAMLQAFCKSREGERSGKRGGDGAERDAVDFVSLMLKKRLFSSPAAFAKTLATHRETIEKVTAAKRGKPASDRNLQLALARLEEDSDDEDIVEEAAEEALSEAAPFVGALTKLQTEQLDRMQAWADVNAHRPDAKAQELLSFIDEICRPEDSAGNRSWNNERLIIFTEYRDAQAYLYERLAQHLPEGEVVERVELLYGGMPSSKGGAAPTPSASTGGGRRRGRRREPARPTKTREEITDEFQADPARCPVRILIATDTASEGIDLQRYCNRLIHYETPFSPVRMEQRNGRIDRHGQPANSALIYHFVGTGWESAPPGSMADDLGFLVRIARRLEQIRDDLGTVGPLLASQVVRRMLGDAAATGDVEPPAERAASARVLKIARDLRDEVARLTQAVCDTRVELGISADAIERAVRVGLAVARQPPLVETTVHVPAHYVAADSLASTQPELTAPRSGEDEVRYRATGDGVDTVEVPAFHPGRLTGSFARTIADLADPISGESRPLTFDHRMAEETERLVLAHLGHPLVAACTRLLRAKIWSDAGGASSLSRVAAVTVEDSVCDELVAIVHARLVVTGAGGHRLHEEIIEAGGRVADGRFSRTGYGVERLRTLAMQLGDDVPPQEVLDALVASWPSIEEPLRNALAARADTRVQSLTRTLEERAASEQKEIEAVLTELRERISEQLSELDPDQLRLGLETQEERDQLDRDIDALRARVDAIPDEIVREKSEIRRRYASRDARLFPAAVSFVVPRNLCGEQIVRALGVTNSPGAVT